jgi:hypothetical protein
MKKNIFFLLLTFSLYSVFAQKNEPFHSINSNEKSKIIEKVNLLQQFIKTGNADLLNSSISNKATAHLSEKLIQMQGQLPKGNFRIDKVVKEKNKTYSVETQMRPFGIPFIIKLDKEFNFLNFDNNKSGSESAVDDYALDSEHISLPFHLVDGFILIDSEINGKYGKLMFDTGTPFGLFLNNHFLGLDTTEQIGKGSTGSGQALKLSITSNLKATISESVHFENLQNIVHSDFEFIEKGITPDFLGFIGNEFIKNYEIVIDYDRQVIDLYKLKKDGTTYINYKRNEPELASMQFTPDTRSKQIPVIVMTVGGEKFEAKFDTGNQGKIKLNEATKTKLLQEGNLVEYNKGNWYGQPDAERITYSIKNIKYITIDLSSVNNYQYSENDKNEFTLGYQFLKNYISVWNYKKETISLFKR